MKKRNSKGLSPNAVQKQKITEALLKTGMTFPEVKEAFKSYDIRRKIVHIKGKKVKRIVMLPKNHSDGDELLDNAIHVSIS